MIDPKTNPLDSAYAVAHYKERCRQLIVESHSRTLCEIGGGRAPLFDDQEVATMGLEYSILDISQEELDLVSQRYGKIRADICQLDVEPLRDRYDLVLSRMVAEHARDGTAMHRNVFALLRPGGIAFHHFPTLFSPAFVVNRLIPEAATRRLLVTLSPNRKLDVPKFPARYSKCFGPSRAMKRLLEGLGYQITEFRPFYGTTYLHGVPVLGRLESAFHRVAAKRWSIMFTSYVWLVLRKPATAQ